MKTTITIAFIFCALVLNMAGCDKKQPAESATSSSIVSPTEQVEKNKPTAITPRELHTLQVKDPSIILLDVRTPEEYEAVHAQGTILIPLNELDATQTAEKYQLKGRDFYVICHSGQRSAEAIRRFVQAGITGGINVTGGTTAWQEAQLPTEKGSPALPSGL